MKSVFLLVGFLIILDFGYCAEQPNKTIPHQEAAQVALNEGTQNLPLAAIENLIFSFTFSGFNNQENLDKTVKRFQDFLSGLSQFANTLYSNKSISLFLVNYSCWSLWRVIRC